MVSFILLFSRYSGVTKKMLASVTTRIEDVQRNLRELLPKDAIIVGQSLNGDMHAIKVCKMLLSLHLIAGTSCLQ
jgi:hypothetical protein